VSGFGADSARLMPGGRDGRIVEVGAADICRAAPTPAMRGEIGIVGVAAAIANAVFPPERACVTCRSRSTNCADSAHA
jgi:hypothetical protein